MKKSLFTFVVVLMVGITKLGLGHFFVYESPFSLFVAAVGICAWYGGYAHAILAYLFSVSFIVFQIIPSLEQLGAQQGFWIYGLCLFALESFVITSGCIFLKNARTNNKRTIQELREVDKTLKERETCFRKVYESNVIGLLFFNVEGYILDANDYFLEMVGYGRDDIVKNHLRLQNMTPPEFRKVSEDALKRLQEQIKILPYEKEYFKSDGGRVPVLIGSSMVSDDMYVSFVLDITDKKKAEKMLFELNENLEAKVEQRTQELSAAKQRLEKLISESETVETKLRQSERFLESVIENIPSMIFVKDANSRQYIRLNKAGQSLWGKTQNEILGKSDHEIFPPIQSDLSQSTNEEVYVTKVGDRYLHTKHISILDDKGIPQYILGIADDVTEKRKNELQRIELLREQVARSEIEKGAERLRILAEATTALNESLDIDSMLQSFSAIAVKNLADWCLIDMLSENSDSIDRLMDAYRDPLLKVMATEYKKSLDLLISPQIREAISEGRGRIYVPPLNQKEMFVSAIIIPLIYYGKVFGALTFVSTDSKKIFNDFDLSTCEDLGKRCSLAVINAQLYNKANEASRAKSAFLANMSHEIRTPLGAMLGFAELTMDEVNLSSQQSSHISAILRNGRHLLRIVDEILDLSKVESERIQIEKVAFSLPKLLDDIFTSLKMKAQEKGLDLIVNLSEDIAVQVTSDPTRIKQILINVIGNAIKFTEKGKVIVCVHLELSNSESGRYLFKVSVEDTGVGISAREINNLFQPFVQADGSMTRKFGGTGLGLFLSRKLARLLNGDVILKKSRFAKGSLFLVTIEVENAERESITHSHSSGSEIGLNESPSNQMSGRILIVDDSEDNQILVAHYLSNLGLFFEVAENGREAVERALTESFDIILMDIQMPEMDGFQAMQLLRQKNYHKPIVALTAHAMKGDRDRCLEAGFDEYLSKPLSKQALHRSLTELFSLRAQKQPGKIV